MTLLLTLLQEGAHQAAESGAGGGPFDINPGLIIWTLVVFGILLFILWRWGFPVLVKSVEERERRIQKQLEEAERANAEAQRLLEEHKKQIAAAHNQAQEILSKAKTVSQKEREALLNRARKDIDAETEKAIQALRREAVELSIAAASRVIEANLDTEANRKLVTDFLESLGKAGTKR